MKCPQCSSENPDDLQLCGSCGISLIEIPTMTAPHLSSRCEENARATDRLVPGRHFGKRYQIVKELGKGGMGIV